MSKKRKKKPSILLLDIENSLMELTFTTFSLWDNVSINPKAITKDSWIHCVGYKWLGDKTTHVVSTHDFPSSFKKDHTNDKHVIKAMHSLLQEADILVGHNMAKFDFPKLNDKFVLYGMKPISKPIIIDTLKEARKIAKRSSYKLEALCQYYASPQERDILKKKHNEAGRSLWEQAFKGDLKATKTMAKYCKQDIFLTEFLFKKLRPYMTSFPNMQVLMGKSETACRNCGSTNLKKNGYRYTNAGKYQRYSCSDCGSSSTTGRENLARRKACKPKS